MIVLSHRGYWKAISEKNFPAAFERSFSLGFGTETDIRDYNGELAISHDVASPASLLADDFFSIYKKYGSNLPLALNIKADGLQQKLHKLLVKYAVENYFVFDMSIPDGLGYIKQDINVFTRQSEYEKEPSYYNESTGVWLDEFQRHWINKETITRHIKNNKKICIVSPDLHKRNYLTEWEHYKEIERELEINNIMLCTDYPEEAREFFNE